MSMVAAALRAMLDAGLDPDTIVTAVAEIEEALRAELTPSKTLRQERNARYYAANRENLKAQREARQSAASVRSKTSESVLNVLSSDHSDAVKTLSDAGRLSQLPLPLHPLLLNISLPKRPLKGSKRFSSAGRLEAIGVLPGAGSTAGADRSADRRSRRRHAGLGRRQQQSSSELQIELGSGLRRMGEVAVPTPKTKATLTDERLLDELLKNYPKRQQPLGIARSETMEALIEARAISQDAEILGGVIGYARKVRSKPKEEQEDRFILSLRRFLQEHRWKEYRPASAEDNALREQVWRMQIEKFKKRNGSWPMGMGPQPGFAGCRAPEYLLREYGFLPENSVAREGGAAAEPDAPRDTSNRIVALMEGKTGRAVTVMMTKSSGNTSPVVTPPSTRICLGSRHERASQVIAAEPVRYRGAGD